MGCSGSKAAADRKTIKLLFMPLAFDADPFAGFQTALQAEPEDPDDPSTLRCKIKSLKFRIQRGNTDPKFAHLYDDSNVVCCCASLLKMATSESAFRSALDLWMKLVNSHWFAKTAFFLILYDQTRGVDAIMAQRPRWMETALAGEEGISQILEGHDLMEGASPAASITSESVSSALQTMFKGPTLVKNASKTILSLSCDDISGPATSKFVFESVVALIWKVNKAKIGL